MYFCCIHAMLVPLLQVDEEFQKLWRSATVDAMDDAKIDEYLEKQGEFTESHSINTINMYVLFFTQEYVQCKIMDQRNRYQNVRRLQARNDNLRNREIMNIWRTFWKLTKIIH